MIIDTQKVQDINSLSRLEYSKRFMGSYGCLIYIIFNV
ncbi:unnamed protein product, partial [Vitis vinifera]|uniref:Uncharacterized protein n=1 Tax=Vitis vinifera TaxID=29760 RepID=D7SHG4_VITVI